MVSLCVPRKKILTKDSYVRAAMEVLRTRGVGGVRVLPLAKKLRVSRGSFYWHFENRQELLDAMLDWWEREMTDVVIYQANASRASAKRRIRLAAEYIVSHDLARYDSAVRSWAQGDKKAAKILRRVTEKRLDYISSLFEEAGFPPAEARSRGDLLAVCLIYESTIHIEESLETRLRLVRRQVRFLTS